MMISRMRTDREGESVTIHNRQDLHAFAAFREAHGVASARGHDNRRIEETLPLVEQVCSAQRTGRLREDLAQNLTMALLLKPAMNGFVIRIVLGQQVPLRADIQNPDHRFKHHVSGSCNEQTSKILE